jgi:hypothetical protein
MRRHLAGNGIRFEAVLLNQKGTASAVPKLNRMGTASAVPKLNRMGTASAVPKRALIFCLSSLDRLRSRDERTELQMYLKWFARLRDARESSNTA